MKPYDIVAELEKKVAEYAGADHCVAVDSCTNALLLCLKYVGCKGKTIELPAYTYVGVAYSVINAGGRCIFNYDKWEGAYEISHDSWPFMIVDSARRFRKDMFLQDEHPYVDTLMCLSGHWGKHLKIGRGGFILTNDAEAARVLRIMRFDGRKADTRPRDDNFVYHGHHCYMLPEEAARGLMLMSSIPDSNMDIPWDDYTDLNNFRIFKEFV